MNRARVTVSVQRAVAAGRLPPAAVIRRWIAAAADPDARGEIAVRLVDEAESAVLNERYRGKAGPTNVLAFPAGADALPPHEEATPIGDLVICAPVVEREAAEQGKTLEAHFAHIAVHGTLHLFGYDHDEEPAAAEMEERERELLAGLGFADPYALDAP